jgi:hypothetical protein
MEIAQFQQFSFEGCNIRTTVDISGNPWFLAGDVCKVLAIANSRHALTRLDPDEKGVATADTLGGQQEQAIIDESGLYSLILTSRKPEAKRFRKWVTYEVLPSIRKTGSFTKLLRDWCNFTEVQIDRVPDPLYGEVNTYPAAAWRALYGIDLAKVFAESNFAPRELNDSTEVGS